MSAVVRRTLRLAVRLALNPAITASLLWLLTLSPQSLRLRLASRFAALRDPRRRAQVLSTLRWMLAAGAVRVANRALNAAALNAWRVRSETGRWRWAGEVAVVTGGSSGFGELIAKGLAARGIKVAVLDIRPLPVGLQGYDHISFFSCDITDPDAVFAAAEKVQRALGAPSVLVNNAGVLDAHSILGTSHEYLRKIFDVNVLSNWTTVRAFLPAMVAQNKGHVVTVASGASYIGIAGLADYTASKAAVLAFHEALNQELRHIYKAPNVLTTSVHPGWARTPLIAPVEQELRARGEIISEPSEVADAVVGSIMACRGGQVFLPEHHSRVSALRGLPNWLQENVRDGISQTILKSVKLKS